MISELIDTLGKEKARSYLLNFFHDEQNLIYWLGLFPNHFPSQFGLPAHEVEMLSLIPKYSRLGFAGPRGSGKSTLLNVAIVSFYALNGISKYSLMVSDTATQSEAHLDALKNELETNALIKWLYGDVLAEPWGVGDIQVKTPYGEAKIEAKGRGQRIRGLKWRNYRPMLAVVDDLEDDEMIDSPTVMAKAKNWFVYNFLRGLAKEWSKVVMIGTILGDNALLNEIIHQKGPYAGWATRKYRALKEDNASYWPEKYPFDYLIAIRDNPSHPEFAGSLVFAQEYQNEPRSESDRIVKRGWIKYYSYTEKRKPEDMEDEWFDKCRIVGAADLAISLAPGAHFFAASTFAVAPDGHFWHLDTIRGHFTAEERAKQIVESLKAWKHDAFGIESNAYQEALRQLVKKEMAAQGVYVSIKKIITDKKKERRAIIHAAKFEGGFVHLRSDHPLTEMLINEILSFPSEPDDTFDSLLLVFDMETKGRARVFAKKPRGF